MGTFSFQIFKEYTFPCLLPKLSKAKTKTKANLGLVKCLIDSTSLKTMNWVFVIKNGTNNDIGFETFQFWKIEIAIWVSPLLWFAVLSVLSAVTLGCTLLISAPALTVHVCVGRILLLRLRFAKCGLRPRGSTFFGSQLHLTLLPQNLHLNELLRWFLCTF